MKPETLPTTATRPAALKVRGVSKWYGAERVLADVTFSIAEGESLVILGHSGSGKTTTLRIIAGLEKPDAGEILLNGRHIEHLRARERNIGVIFQNYALFPRLTVAENICFGLRIRGVKRNEREQVAADLLQLIGLTGQSDKYPSQLSGGQQQRVAIARALAYKPSLLLFDESFSALDPQMRGGLRREIRALLRQLRVPALFITHDQEEAMELGDQIAILNRGQLEQIGSPEQIYHHPRSEFVASFLGAANIIDLHLLDQKLLAEDRSAHSLQVSSESGQSGQSGEARARRLLFRPEEVVVQPAPGSVEALAHLGTGRVVEVGFAGATEWLSIELDVQISQPSSRPTMIRVSRTRWESRQSRLIAGDHVALGLRTFQILE
jgi:putative spermidine/putrescine transport system ATP-binding protein